MDRDEFTHGGLLRGPRVLECMTTGGRRVVSRISWRLLPALAMLLLGAATQARGGDLVPYLVRDIDATSYAGSSNPRQFALAPSMHYGGLEFTAFGNRELWLYDGREDVLATVLRRPEIRQLSGSFYVTREEAGGWALWSTRGWPYDGAFPVRSRPWRRFGAAYAAQTAGVESPILFEADDGRGLGLWSLGGWAGEAVQVARPVPLPDGHLLRDLTPLPDVHFKNYGLTFVARHPQLGLAVWTSDGTSRGTGPIFAPFPGTAAQLAIVGVIGPAELLLAGGDGDVRLWLSNGHRDGTREVARLVRRGGRVVDSIVAGGLAYLVVEDGDGGEQLWASDGTAKGTRRLAEFPSRHAFGTARLATVGGDTRLLFFVDDGVHGNEPWTSDGTLAGTYQIADLCPGPCGSAGEGRGTAGNGRALFAATLPESGRELWATDGTAAGTDLLVDACPGACDGLPRDVVAPDGLFTARDATERALWRTDGTAAGTVRLTAAGVRLPEDGGAATFARSSSPGQGRAGLAAPGSSGLELGYFAAWTRDFGEELWTTDGTPEGTKMFVDLQREQDGGSYPYLRAAAGSRLLFLGQHPPDAGRYWTSDGTAAGTEPARGPGPPWRLATVVSGGGRTFLAGPVRGSRTGALWSLAESGPAFRRLTTPGTDVYLFPRGLENDVAPVVIRGRAFFFATASDGSVGLWTSDGSVETTQRVTTLSAVATVDELQPSVQGSFGGSFLFARSDDAHLWISDGTAAGTRRLLDVSPFLAPLEQCRSWTERAELPGTLFFQGPGSTGECGALWISDGTEPGTHPLLVDGTEVAPLALLAAETQIFFLRYLQDGAPGLGEWWATDGTPARTVRVPATTRIGETGDAPPFVFGDRLLFIGEGETYGRHYWVSDGTAAGTFALLDAQGQEITGQYFDSAASFAGRLVFCGFGSSGASHLYAWNGDGPTAVGMGDAAGVLCAGPFVQAGPRLFFPGYEPRTGVELWALQER